MVSSPCTTTAMRPAPVPALPISDGPRNVTDRKGRPWPNVKHQLAGEWAERHPAQDSDLVPM